MANYFLNVKVLKLEGLMYEGQPANDRNPFVRVHLHEQQQFYKSETAHQEANHEYNEQIEIPVYDPQKDELEVEVLSEEINNTLDLADPYLIPLNTLKLGNFIAPIELELSKDGNPTGRLSLELQLTKKDASRIDKFSGPILLRVNVLEAKGVTEIGDDGQNQDTYLTFLLEGHDESETIKSIVNHTSTDPAWNQSFSIICEDPDKDVLLIKMISAETVIIPGEKQPISDLEPGTRATQGYDFNYTNSETGGHLTLEFESFDLSTFSKKPVNIHLKVVKGTDLKKMDADKSDPYVVATVGDQKVSTEVQKNTLNPEWNQEFDFVSKDPLHDKLTLQLLDKDVAFDDKMMDDVVFAVRDFKSPEDKTPILYDVPIKLKGKNAGHLTFEILAEGECLRIQKATGECIIEFTVVEATFKHSQNVHVTYGLLSNEEDPPIDIEVGEEVKMKCANPQEDTLVVSFDDSETGDDLCDPIVVELKSVSINALSEIHADTILDDEVTGHAHLRFFIKEIPKEMEQVEKPSDYSMTTERAVDINENEYCDFQWGNYGSSYSTSFTGYSNCTPLSSEISETEKRFHRHPILDDEPNAPTKPKRTAETFSGSINSVQSDSTDKVSFVVGDQYYATAVLYGKSSRSSSKFGPIQSEPVEAKEANRLNFNNYTFNFESKLKKGDFIEVIVYHQKDKKQVAKSTISLEKVPQSENEASNTFDLFEYRYIKDPAKVGTLQANLKHTIQFK